MPTENEEKVQQRTKKYASEVKEELKSLRQEEGPKAWRQAELIYDVNDKKLWQILGCETMRDFYEELFISRSTWYSRLKVFGWAKIALDREIITRQRLNRLPMQNVKQLQRLDERRQYATNWIEKAIAMKESDFEAAVDAILAGGDDDDANQPESRTMLKINCTASQKTFIIESMAEFAKRQDPPLELDDEAHILELAMADMRSGKDEAMDASVRAWVQAGRPSMSAQGQESSGKTEKVRVN